MSRKQLDVTHAHHVMETVCHMKPDVIIHAAAMTAVDAAEEHSELAHSINAYGTRNVAAAAKQIDAKLLYVSTDYVFSGDKGLPYVETDIPSPLNVYGKTKLLGEQFVESICDKYFIVRTSWLYGSHGNNFVKKIVAASRRNHEIFASADNIGSPTYSYDLACFLQHLMMTDKYGIYHASGNGCCSRYEFAEAILKEAGMFRTKVIPVQSDVFALPAVRPLNTSLDNLAIRKNELPALRHWRIALQEFVQKDLFFKKGMGAV